MSAKIDNTFHISVVITGMAGFGKSTIAIALCHQPLIKKHFPNGFLRIQLGVTPKDRYSMLSLIYRELTGNAWTNPINSAQGTVCEDDMVTCLSRELNSLCKRNSKLLVIIDDVWEVEEAVDYAKTFSGCKIVLTTRRKDVASSIHCKHKICVDSMESSEAFRLLTSEIKDLQINNSVTESQLNELAINLYNWPLLLNLVRGQLDNHCKTMPNSPLAVIERVTKKLYENGLTAFDRKRPERKIAVNASIKASLDLLSEENVARLNRLITSVLFGSIIPKQLLMYIWQISNEKMSECCDDFWSVGLFSFASSSFEKTCIEIHLVITQYVFDNIKYDNAAQIVLYSFFDSSNLMQYYMQYFISKPQMEFDENRLGTWIIDLYDSVHIPYILYKMPLMLQTLTGVFMDRFDVEKTPKKSFMGVKDKYKTLVSYLNNRKRDEAITLMTEEMDKHTQDFTKLLNCICSCTQLSLSIRKVFGNFTSWNYYPQYAKIYVNMRSDLYDLLIMSKTFSWEKFFDIIKTSSDQMNKISMSLNHELSACIQTILSEIPNNVELPRGLQTAADLSMLCQSSDNNSTYLDFLSSMKTYFSQNQDALSDTSCEIS